MDVNWRRIHHMDLTKSPSPHARIELLIDAYQCHIRAHPTLPADPDSPENPFTDVASGIRLPPVHCAWRGCQWCGSSYAELERHINDCHAVLFNELVAPICDVDFS